MEKSSFSLATQEVYNETIRDLLAPEGAAAQALDLREDGANRILVAGLSEHFPKSGDQVMELVARGTANRTKSATKANEDSSRSHAVFQINIQQRERTANIATQVQSATLTLCDLAGSERASATENRGQQMREGANINRY
jgi:kinesin family protein 18/19